MLAVKVFSATTTRDRTALGDVVTAWLDANSSVVIDRIEVRQSSDDSHHCLTIVVFYRAP